MLNNMLVNLMIGISSLGGVLNPEDFDATWRATWGWVIDVANTIFDVLWPILIVVGAAGAIWAVVLGVNMARADSTEKREEAKKRLINVIIGIAVTIGLILFFILFITVILPALLPGAPNQGTQTFVNALNMFRLK